MRNLIAILWLVATSLLAHAPAASAAAVLPSYRIIADETTALGRTVDIRLKQNASEAELSAIISDVAGKSPAKAPRTSVNFYLPGMSPEGGAWASGTHAGSVGVRIQGLRLDEAERFASDARGDARTVVGVWLTVAPATPGRLMIYRENGRVFADWLLRQGDSIVEELIESQGVEGRRFDMRGRISSEHFILKDNGKLSILARDVVLSVADRVDVGAADPAEAAAAAPDALAPAKSTAASISIVSTWPPEAGKAMPARQTVAVAVTKEEDLKKRAVRSSPRPEVNRTGQRQAAAKRRQAPKERWTANRWNASGPTAHLRRFLEPQ